jgi:hypothetical protein
MGATTMIGLTVRLSHAPNPDIAGGYWDEPIDPRKAQHALVNSLINAQQTARDYIERNNLGGGNWNGGDLRLDGKSIGRISFNGRAWRLDGTEMPPDADELGVYAAAKPRRHVRFGSEGQPVEYEDADDASEHFLRMAEGLC